MSPAAALQTKADLDQVLVLLPKGWNDAERQGMVFQKTPHEIESLPDLLALILMYVGHGWTLRKAAHWAEESGLAKISNVGFLKWLKKTGVWLEWIAMELLSEQQKWLSTDGIAARAVDGSVVTMARREPQERQRKRLHLEIDLRTGLIANCMLTDYKKGETLSRFEAGQGSRLLIGDRLYASRKPVLNRLERKDHVLVRLALNKNFPLADLDGNAFDLEAFLQACPKNGETIERPACLVRPGSKVLAPGRLIILKKDIETSQHELERQERKAKKQNRILSENSRLACQFFILWTSLPVEVATKEEILQLYRQRWQVEWLARRLKSGSGINDLRNRDSDTAQTWLWAKIILALLTEKVGRLSGAFPPA